MTWFLLPFIVIACAALAFAAAGLIIILLFGICNICSFISEGTFEFTSDSFKKSIVFTLVSGIVALTMFGIAVGIKYLVG